VRARLFGETKLHEEDEGCWAWLDSAQYGGKKRCTEVRQDKTKDCHQPFEDLFLIVAVRAAVIWKERKKNSH
jgi:hypothetical protein